MKIRYLPAASREAIDAARWFRDRDPTSEPRFRARLNSVMSAVADNPHLGVEISAGVRQFPLTPFPYVVVYEVNSTEITVLAVAHTKLRAYWPAR